jgi:hypothetical protein
MSGILQYCTLEKELSDVLCEQYRENLKSEGLDMAKAQRYSMEQICAVQKRLRALPLKRVGKTRAEVVEVLAGDIRKAMEKRHSPAEIRGHSGRGRYSGSLIPLGGSVETRGRDCSKKGR